MQGLETAMDRRDALKKAARFFNRHLEHFGNVSAAVANVERFAVVARPAADFAGHEQVGQKLHLDLDHALAFAVLAPSTFDVK